MKIVIFGNQGQVGRSLTALMMKTHDIHGYDLCDFDLCDFEKIKSIITSLRPQWVINASAYTAVDRAEQESDLADKINHLAPAVMAQSCAQLTCGFLHYSTDYVFDGRAQQPYVETDRTNPQSVYGVTKLAGENAVLKVYPDSIILRTAWVYAHKGNNFVNTMLRLATERDELSVVGDQIGSPTLAYDLATMSVEIIEKTPLLGLRNVAGVYHATGGGQTSWCEFAKAIFELQNVTINLKEITTKEYPTPAPRPQFSVLDNEKLQRVFNVKLPQWRTSLAGMLDRLKA